MRLPSGWLPEGEDFLDNTGREFYTLKGYQLQNGGDITESMEDYLEMIGRCMEEHGYVRVGALADKLNVRPSSVSKMVGRLRELGLVQFEKYGLITLTKKGDEIAAYLLWRHDVLLRFFQRLNHTGGQLSLVEQVEHFMDQETVRNLERLLDAFPKDFEK